MRFGIFGFGTCGHWEQDIRTLTSSLPQAHAEISPPTLMVAEPKRRSRSYRFAMAEALLKMVGSAEPSHFGSIRNSPRNLGKNHVHTSTGK
jgi:hypothetical protein